MGIKPHVAKLFIGISFNRTLQLVDLHCRRILTREASHLQKMARPFEEIFIVDSSFADIPVKNETQNVNSTGFDSNMVKCT